MRARGREVVPLLERRAMGSEPPELPRFRLGVKAGGCQHPNYNNGPVWRVVYVDVKSGMGDAF